MKTWRGLLALLGGSLVARGFGAAAGLLLQLAIARSLGAEGAGIFFLCVMIMTLAAILAKVGMDNTLLRQASVAWDRKDQARLGQIYAQGLLTTLTLSVLALVGLVQASEWVSVVLFAEPLMTYPLQIFALSIVPTVIVWVNGAMLKAMGMPGRAALAEVALLPLMTLMIGANFYLNDALIPFTMSLAYLAGNMLAALYSFVPLFGKLRVRHVSLPQKLTLFPRGSFDLTLIELVQFVMAMATIPLVGMLMSTEDVGVFGTALRITTQLTIVGVLVGNLISPRLAAYHANGDMAGMERVAQRGAGFSLALSLPVLLALILMPELIVMLFGSEFEGVQGPLRILAVAHLIKLLCGPAGYCLVMAGHERKLRNLLILSVVTGLPMTALLIGEFGLVAAALGSAYMLCMQAVGALLIARNELNIHTFLTPWPRALMAPAAATNEA